MERELQVVIRKSLLKKKFQVNLKIIRNIRFIYTAPQDFLVMYLTPYLFTYVKIQKMKLNIFVTK